MRRELYAALQCTVFSTLFKAANFDPDFLGFTENGYRTLQHSADDLYENNVLSYQLIKIKMNKVNQNQNKLKKKMKRNHSPVR